MKRMCAVILSGVLLSLLNEDKQSHSHHTSPALKAEPVKVLREMVINRRWRRSFNSVPK